jgi:carbonic anhydrase/acetyltransferase-like protein (isoleucine patch superfamily)
MILRSYQGKSPRVHPTAFVAETAVLIGDVEIGPKAGIWYNVVLRGDVNSIRIGEETNIQDGTVIHAETMNGPTLIGRRVTVGHNAIVHGCTIEDECLIGMGAIVLSYSKIGKGSVIAAGALVKEHDVVPPGTVMAGIPAKTRGPVSESMAQRASIGCDHYLELAEEYKR